MFQGTVRKFARERIVTFSPRDGRSRRLPQGPARQLFELGLMGIEIPEEYGGQGGTFFQAVLAIEELAAVDPAAAVVVDVQNTLVNNALLRWGNEEQKQRWLPRLAADTVGAYALSEAGSGSDAFALATRAVDDGDHYVLTGRKLWITNAAEAGLFLMFANANPAAGYKGITCFLVEREFPGFPVGKSEDKLGIRASSTCELMLDDCRVPKADILGEIGKGYKIAMETLNEGRIGIGAQMTGLARGALEHAVGLRQAAQAVRQGDRRVPGRPVRAGAHGHRDRGRAAAGLQRRPPARSRRALPDRGRHGQVVRLRDRRARRLAGRRDPRRRRLHQGLSGRKAVSRRQNRQHLRRHHQHPAADHRQALLSGRGKPAAASCIRSRMGRDRCRCRLLFAALAAAPPGRRPPRSDAGPAAGDHPQVRGQGGGFRPRPRELHLSPALHDRDAGRRRPPATASTRRSRTSFSRPRAAHRAHRLCADGHARAHPDDAQDVQDMRSIQPFVLTTKEIDKYEIHYLGRDQVDEITCYVFAVKPKQMREGERYFAGEIWVDDRDLQIVKTYGRGVGPAEEELGPQVPQVRDLPRTDRRQVLVPDLHRRQRHAELPGGPAAHPRNREVRGLQAVPRRVPDQVRRAGR